MYLHREPIAGIQELDEPGEGGVVGGGAEQRLRMVLDERLERLAGERTADDHTAVQGVVADAPALAVKFPLGEGPAQEVAQAAAPPDQRTQERLKTQWGLHRTRFTQAAWPWLPRTDSV